MIDWLNDLIYFNFPKECSSIKSLVIRPNGDDDEDEDDEDEDDDDEDDGI